MPPLNDIQRAFHAAIFHNATDLAKEITKRHGLSGDTRIHIYRSSVLGIQTDALAAVYPVIQRLVGEKFFKTLGRDYLSKHPSPSGDLHDLGAEMPEFLSTLPAVSELPYLKDVARLEWAWHRVFHAADDTNLDLQSLADISADNQESIVFSLRKGARLLESDYPIHRIWEVNQEDYSKDRTVNLDEGDIKLIVWRQNFELRIDPLHAAESQLLHAIKKGLPLEALIKRMNNSPLPFEQLLPNCVAKGWISGFNLAPTGKS
jgi:hypothetical protein